MVLVINRNQPLFRNVGINLRGRDVRVAQEFLNHPQIRAIF